MKRAIILLCGLYLALNLVGCATMTIGSTAGKMETDVYKSSGEKIKKSAEDFKVYWPYVSGFVAGLYAPTQDKDMPPRIRDLMASIDVVQARAEAGTWTEKDKGLAIGSIVHLEIEATKYAMDERGITTLKWLKSIMLLWGL